MELLIVIAIIAILTVALLPSVLKAPAKARDAVRIKKVNDIQTAVEASYAQKGVIPPIASGDSSPCFGSSTAASLEMTMPIDPAGLGSCADLPVANKDKYFYKVDSSSPAKFYIIGAKVEVPASGNSSKNLAELTAASTLDAAKALIDRPTIAVYYLAVGPL